ncbi:MAG: hypothetical protein A2511_11715 [Deltaproteobacteria bacterium RIFOXYD12_FULL_50_9]|nr:MAG: hypothetical protein A2511_11715 [Deltaproteobacteria bacterium RIFOXYD12_FULL_50_9]
MFRTTADSEETIGYAGVTLLKRQLQWQLFLRVVVLSLLLGISALLQIKHQNLFIPPLPYVAYFIAGVYLFTIISSFFLKAINNYQIFAYIQLLIDAALTTCLVFFTGGSQSIFTIIFFFPIICGSFMLYRSGGLLLAAVSTIGYGAVLLIEFYRIFQGFTYLMWGSSLFNIFIVLHYFAIHGFTFFLVAVLSILLSERLRKTETALSQTTLDYDRLNLLYKQIFNDISAGIITVNNRGLITSVNHAAEEITGFKAYELLHNNIQYHLPDLLPVKSDAVRPTVWITRKDNEKIPIGYSWARLNMPNEEGEFRVFTFQDLSRIKKMEDQIRQAEKMAAIGEMAAGVAHEFRNPLAAISGAAQMLTQEIDNRPTCQGLMNIINRECDRMERTISDFLRFARPLSPKKDWFSLTELSGESLFTLKHTPAYHERCKIVIDIPADLSCWGDRQQINQVLVNILSNACNALSEQGGKILVAARERKEKDSENILITVSDNGPGISENILLKIFEPFFTTRENGNGLGLAVVQQIIESHGGTITAGNQTPNGAIFRIMLPLP